MKIGFTGTREGMTDEQKEVVLQVLLTLNITEAHHGDCIGADEDFYDLIRRYFANTRIFCHPPIIERYRAFCEIRPNDIRFAPVDYMDRNLDIVRSCDLLIATPKEKDEQLRSGTWATVRFARKQGKRIIIVFPDGTGSDNNDRAIR